MYASVYVVILLWHVTVIGVDYCVSIFNEYVVACCTVTEIGCCNAIFNEFDVSHFRIVMGIDY